MSPPYPQPWLLDMLALVWGALWGSFFNVCISRLPERQSIVKPASHCPRCLTPIRWYDNIPVLSFIILLGRCRDCKERISLQYPLIELITALISLALFRKFVPLTELAGPLTLQLSTFFFFFAFAGALLVISVIDLKHGIVPNEISLPGIILGLLCSALTGVIPWDDSLLGAVTAGLSLLLLGFVYTAITGRSGLGGGDVKLLSMIGAFLGWRALPFVLFFAAAQGTLIALPVLIWSRARGKGGWSPQRVRVEAEAPQEAPAPEQNQPVGSMALPFGPFLSLAALEFLFFGEMVIGWYWYGG